MRKPIYTDRFYRERYRTIKRTIMRNGFALRMMRYITQLNARSDNHQQIEQVLAQELYDVFIELGPTFIKFGQLLSTHRELLPTPFIKTLESLQDDVEPFSTEEAYNIFFKSFGIPIELAFERFDPLPIASGSIAQVHKAVLQGIPVCVKIQRPNIKEIIGADIHVLKRLVKILKRFLKIAHNLDFEAIIDEFAHMMSKEMDFSIESENLKTFTKLHRTDKYIKVPEVIQKYSSNTVLTMSFIDAPSLKQIYDNKILDHNLIARRLLYSFSNQVFRDGFFHADPHPGNILIRDESHIYFIDFGIIGTISPKLKHLLLKLFFGVTLSSPRIISDAFYGMGIIDPSKVPVQTLERSIERILDKYLNLALNQIRLEDIFNDANQMLRSYNIFIPAELTLLGKTFVTLEGIILSLDESSNILELATPIARKLIFRFISPRYLKHDLLTALFDTAGIGRELPGVGLNALRKIASDDFIISVKSDLTTKNLERELAQKRWYAYLFFSLSLVMAALIIGGALQGLWTKDLYVIGLVLTSISALIIFWKQTRKGKGNS